MTTPQTTHTDRLITLISGVFLLAALVVGGTQLDVNLDIERPDTSPATAAAQGSNTNQNVGFNLNIQPKPVSINEFETSETEVYVGDPFTLSWETTNAREVAAFGDWGGSLSSATGTHTQSVTENTAGQYTYGLRAEGYGANPDTVTDDLTVDVIQPPEFSLSGHDVDLDGVPGATAEMELTLESLHEYEGVVDLVIDDIDPENENSDGDELISFSFSPDNSPYVADTNDASNPVTVDLEMEVLRPIRTDVEYTVTILGTDQSGNAATTNQDIEIKINAEGFSPRTIEEF